MFGQDDELRIRPGSHCKRHLARQPEAGASIRNPDQVISEAVSCQFLASGCACEVVRGISMRVIDMHEWQKSVQKGLDGWTRANRLVEAVREVVDHLGIAHALAFEQRKHILQEQ